MEIYHQPADPSFRMMGCNYPTQKTFEFGPSQKESSLPSIIFQVRTVGFREGNYLEDHSQDLDTWLMVTWLVFVP